MLKFINKLFTPVALFIFNLLLILSAEFIGNGNFFAKTGLIHYIVLFFVGLIALRVFYGYAYYDYILKVFLKIQLAFFAFLGVIHLYEYLGLSVFHLGDEAVEMSVFFGYLMWLVGTLIAMEFVMRLYQKKSSLTLWLLSGIAVMLAAGIVLLNTESGLAFLVPSWTAVAVLVLSLGFGITAIISTWRIGDIMPIFNGYVHYSIPAIALVVLAALFEYFESVHFLSFLGISDVQNLYFSHFIIYAALSLLLIGFTKLKRPTGVYGEN